MNIKIKELPENERPRERLINNGVSSLSDEELLSILLKSGTKNMSVKMLSSYLLKKYGSIKNLKDVSYNELMEIHGIGPTKACSIVALVELSKRMNVKVDKIAGIVISDPRVIYEYFKDRVSNTQENFYCLYLDGSKRVISEKLLFVGTVNYSMVHPRDIFKEAYKLNATNFVCVHNHPSGRVDPSNQDIVLTERLAQIGDLMGVELLDHIIITENSYYSFVQNGKL